MPGPRAREVSGDGVHAGAICWGCFYQVQLKKTKKKHYPNLSTVVALTADTHLFFVLLFFPPWLSVSAS